MYYFAGFSCQHGIALDKISFWSYNVAKIGIGVMRLKNAKEIKKLVLSAMFLAMGFVLPFFTGQIPTLGSALLPMHLPVFFCGFICGWQYGGAVGVVLPVLRSLFFGMPPLFPTAVSMSVELAVYGLVSGAIYLLLKRKNLLALYVALVTAMLAGRAVWGLAQLTLLGLSGGAFTFNAFILGAFITAVPGMILQLILIPVVMVLLHSTKVLRFGGELS